MKESHTLDYVNIGLMLFSLVLAFILPFELFLFSYAVLGPLHYLTEISWLHQRNYFSTEKKDFWILVGLCFLISVVIVYSDFYFQHKEFRTPFIENISQAVFKVFNRYYPAIFVSALFTALAMVLTKKFYTRIIAMLLGFLIAIPFSKLPFMTIWIGTFLPTLIHVFIFTGLFIFYGALKNNSLPGYLSLAVFILCTACIFLIAYVPEGAVVSQYVRDAIIRSGFSEVNKQIVGLFKNSNVNDFDLFGSWRGWMVQRFVAFAYTYHYLNWFSKTEVIRWHKVPKPWLIASILIWMGSVFLYWIDYRTGLITLFFLSMLHVFLEFPLNIKSIQGIFQETFRLLKWNKST